MSTCLNRSIIVQIFTIILLAGCGGSSGGGGSNDGPITPDDPGEILKATDAVASTTTTGTDPDNVYDLDYSKAWISSTLVSTSPQWIYLDFGSAKTISQVIISWGDLFAQNYKLQISDDATSWKDVSTCTSGDGHFDSITLSTEAQARYLRLYVTKSYGDNWAGVCVEEISVYDTDGHNPPDAPSDGNMIWNGNFTSGTTEWSTNFQYNGSGSYSFSNGSADISITSPGDYPYSIQLSQGTLNLKKGEVYTLSFDGWADANRSCLVTFHEYGVDLNGDSNPWTDYVSKSFTLTTAKQTFTFSFIMNSNDDPNAVFEMDTGTNAAACHFDNFTLTKRNANGTDFSSSTTITTIALSNPFNLITTPGRTQSNTSNSKLFPIGTDDSKLDFVPISFQIAETETTYGLWKEVYDWAIAHGYCFQNSGCEGHDGIEGANPTTAKNEPVTYISWRDAIVWCNALTEYCNSTKGTGYECVYSYNNTIIRDSRNSNATACDNAVQSSSSKGFRLPTSMEWEFAARYRGNDSTNAVLKDGIYYTKGNSASGATADYIDADATNAVASSGSFLLGTTNVKQKGADFIGLFDMSGNVREYCFPPFEISSSLYCTVRGGDYFYSDSLQIGKGNIICNTTEIGDSTGFRICKNK